MFEIGDHARFNKDVYRVTAIDDCFIQLNYKIWVKINVVEKIELLEII